MTHFPSTQQEINTSTHTETSFLRVAGEEHGLVHPASPSCSHRSLLAMSFLYAAVPYSKKKKKMYEWRMLLTVVINRPLYHCFPILRTGSIMLDF